MIESGLEGSGPSWQDKSGSGNPRELNFQLPEATNVHPPSPILQPLSFGGLDVSSRFLSSTFPSWNDDDTSSLLLRLQAHRLQLPSCEGPLFYLVSRSLHLLHMS